MGIAYQTGGDGGDGGNGVHNGGTELTKTNGELRMDTGDTAAELADRWPPAGDRARQ
jgi:hypothetical protein